MTRRGLALLMLLALSQVASSYAADNYFEASTEIFDKFMADLIKSWHGIYRKHLPTGATGPVDHDLSKKGRLPLAVQQALGVTGHSTGPKHVVDNKHAVDNKHSVDNKHVVDKIVEEKVDAAESVQNFFQDALTSLRDRMEEGSKDFIAAAAARGEKINQMSSEFKDRVAIAYENTMMTADEFLSGILGQNYRDYFPQGMDMTNWSQLGAFRFEGTMADMVDLLNFDDVTSARDLFEQLSESDKLFCAKEIIVPTEKIPTTCVGPIVSLVLRPKTCVLNAVKKELVCDPAKLVLVKTPGECTFKHKSAFEYVGKQCRIVSTIGLSKDVVIGGGEFSIEFEKTKATVNTSSRLVDVAVE